MIVTRRRINLVHLKKKKVKLAARVYNRKLKNLSVYVNNHIFIHHRFKLKVIHSLSV